MYCNEILKTIRGDTFEVNIYNKNYDINVGDIITMSIKRTPDSETILTKSSKIKKNDITSLKISPKETEKLEGFYYFDLEISNEKRTYVETPLLAELKVERDVTVYGKV